MSVWFAGIGTRCYGAVDEDGADVVCLSEMGEGAEGGGHECVGYGLSVVGGSAKVEGAETHLVRSRPS